MKRYIDADKLMTWFDDHYDFEEFSVGYISGIIREQPTADVREVKRGKWERHYSRQNVYADLLWHCSVCGGKTDVQYANRYFKFCPYCGARMEEA